jgi:hypothetical protein
MGVCSVSAFIPSTTATNVTCTGIPASTSVAVHCSASGAFNGSSTTLYARATGTNDQIAVTLSAANSNSVSLTCMWMKP